MKLNLTSLQFKDLNGNIIKYPGDLQKDLGNLLHRNSLTIEQADLSRAIHGGEDVVLKPGQKAWMLSVVKNAPGVFMWLKDGITDYINGLEEVKEDTVAK